MKASEPGAQSQGHGARSTAELAVGSSRSCEVAGDRRWIRDLDDVDAGLESGAVERVTKRCEQLRGRAVALGEQQPVGPQGADAGGEAIERPVVQRPTVERDREQPAVVPIEQAENREGDGAQDDEEIAAGYGEERLIHTPSSMQRLETFEAARG